MEGDLYCDASALLPLLVVERGTAWAKATIQARHAHALVSDFAAAEVASSLSKLVRMGLVGAAAAEAVLHRFDDWLAGNTMLVQTSSQDINQAAATVRRFELKLRTPDALHIVLARRSGATLVTLDRQMVSAAQALRMPVLTLAA